MTMRDPDRYLPDPGFESPPEKCASCDEPFAGEDLVDDVFGTGRHARKVRVCPACYAESNPDELEDV